MNIKRSQSACRPGKALLVAFLYLAAAISGCEPRTIVSAPEAKQCDVGQRELGCDQKPGPGQRTWTITVGTAGENVNNVNPYKRRVCPGDIVKWQAVPPKDFIRWDVDKTPFKKDPQCYASAGGVLECYVLEKADVESACYEYNMIGKKGDKPLDPHIIVE